MSKIKGNIFDFKLFKKLMVYVSPYERSYYLVMFFAFCLSSFSILTPYLLKITVDDYISKRDYEGMLFYIGLMLSLLLVVLRVRDVPSSGWPKCRESISIDVDVPSCATL